MARKKKKKVDVNRGSDRRDGDRRANEFWSKVENGFKKFLESPFKKQENKMARTENERTRDDRIINLLNGIRIELQKLNKNLENKNAAK